MDDMEQIQTQVVAPKLADMKMEGDDVPENLRGKSATDVLLHVKALGEALKISEHARTQAEMTAQTALRTAQPVAAPVVEGPKELTDEELTEIHSADPLKAIRIMNEQAIRRAETNLEARLSPLFQGTSRSVEDQARAKYPDEFVLFGDQISQLVGALPNAKSVMSNPQAWDDLVSLVRGRSGNIEKLIEKRTQSVVTQQRETAQAQQVETMGFTEAAGRRSAIPQTVAQLDPVMREIAEKLDMTPEEYVKWAKV
jgi:hypothetical protein